MATRGAFTTGEMSLIMKYFINGAEVTADKYNTECDDNFNCGIAFTEEGDADNTYMTYEAELAVRV